MLIILKRGNLYEACPHTSIVTSLKIKAFTLQELSRNISLSLFICIWIYFLNLNFNLLCHVLKQWKNMLSLLRQITYWYYCRGLYSNLIFLILRNIIGFIVLAPYWFIILSFLLRKLLMIPHRDKSSFLSLRISVLLKSEALLLMILELMWPVKGMRAHLTLVGSIVYDF